MKEDSTIVIDGKTYSVITLKELNKLKSKKPAEFSKQLAIFMITFSLLCVIANYVLAFVSAENVNEGVTLAMITNVLVTNISYMLYQGYIKNSRNKYGIDGDGRPHGNQSIN